MKTWIRFMLPSDEYKQQKIIYMMAEGFLLTLISTVLVLCLNLITAIDLTFAAIIIIGMALVYVTVRYSLSGIEYTNVASKKAFQVERKTILKQSLMFAGIFTVLTAIITAVNHTFAWIDLLALFILTFSFMYMLMYLSLKRSFKKNKEVLDDE